MEYYIRVVYLSRPVGIGLCKERGQYGLETELVRDRKIGILSLKLGKPGGGGIDNAKEAMISEETIS